MTIAIDFDGTIQRSSQPDVAEMVMWGNIVNEFKRFGHVVIIATMRTAVPGMRDEADAAADVLEVPIVFCGGKGLKDEVCRAAGYRVDVWIDDMPESIRNIPIIGSLA